MKAQKLVETILVLVEVERNTRTVVEKTHNINTFRRGKKYCSKKGNPCTS